MRGAKTKKKDEANMTRFSRRKFIRIALGLLSLAIFFGDFIRQVTAQAEKPDVQQKTKPQLQPLTEQKQKTKIDSSTPLIIKDIEDPYDPRLVEQNTRMPEPSPNPKWALVIDVGACIGCRRCMYACRLENNIPETIYPLWIQVFEADAETPLSELSRENCTPEYTSSPKPGKRYIPVQCMHCDNAPCVKVCPTGARYKSEDGIVDTNYYRCIGCRYCMVSCPYSANRFNWYKPVFREGRELNPEVPVRPVGVIEKCTFCSHRVRKGYYPRCVEVCPVKARRFGDLNDPESEVSKILEEVPSIQLLQELGTQPRIYYITRGVKWNEEGEKWK